MSLYIEKLIIQSCHWFDFRGDLRLRERETFQVSSAVGRRIKGRHESALESVHYVPVLARHDATRMVRGQRSAKRDSFFEIGLEPEKILRRVLVVILILSKTRKSSKKKGLGP